MIPVAPDPGNKGGKGEEAAQHTHDQQLEEGHDSDNDHDEEEGEEEKNTSSRAGGEWCS